MWSGRRYHSLDYYLKENFGEKIYKLSLDGGMTCPNRDGKISVGGCIFCSADGSGDFAVRQAESINLQLESAKALVAEKFCGSRYIAFFQSFTNTYADVSYLRELFMPVIMREDIAVLDIATRPDCLEADKLELIRELAGIKPVWVELGLQTSSNITADLINRGYPTEIYAGAVRELHRCGAQVITHMIIGLPGETNVEMLATARHIADCGSDGIKLQLLHILRGTRLYDMYKSGQVRALDEQEYISMICDIIAVLPENVVIHRLTGDGDKRLLEAPLWSCNNRRVLNLISHELKNRGIIQGCRLIPS